jgi:hypothetical protein
MPSLTASPKGEGAVGCFPEWGTPHPASARQQAAKLSHPSPKGEGRLCSAFGAQPLTQLRLARELASLHIPLPLERVCW